MKRTTATQPRGSKKQTPAPRRRSGDPIDPMPRVIERKKVKHSGGSSRGQKPGRKTPSTRRTTLKTSARSARQVGRTIGAVLGKVIGSVEHTVAKVMPGRTRSRVRTV